MKSTNKRMMLGGTPAAIDLSGFLIFLHASWTALFFIYSLLKRLLLVLICNFSYKELDNSHKENIDLTRVRVVNQIKHIFVRQGHRI